ncbi:MAG: dihydroneopterin aldolase [Brevundimonas sp.]|nr:MAG: dihydroneopterin aldolase [Brevundimonas sp.]
MTSRSSDLSDFTPLHEALIVFVRGLRLDAGIGVYAHEQGRLQPLIVDVTLTLTAGPVEGLGDTVNYERVAEAARGLIDAGHIELVETLAERLAVACLALPRVTRAAVRIEKPEALAGAEAAGCEVVLAR